MTIPILHTDRLILRPITAADLPAFFEIFRDERAMRFMPSLPHLNVDDTQRWFEDGPARAGQIHWAICLKNGTDVGNVIGHINYLQTRIPGMGYILHPDYWGQGYTVEAARAALEYGFDHLGYERVELWIDDTNTRSMRVAQKLGFGIKGRIALRYRHEARHHHMFVYGMRAHEWRCKDEPADPPSFFKMEPALLVHNLQGSVDFYVNKLGFQLDFLFGDPPLPCRCLPRRVDGQPCHHSTVASAARTHNSAVGLPLHLHRLSHRRTLRRLSRLRRRNRLRSQRRTLGDPRI